MPAAAAKGIYRDEHCQKPKKYLHYEQVYIQM